MLICLFLSRNLASASSCNRARVSFSSTCIARSISTSYSFIARSVNTNLIRLIAFFTFVIRVGCRNNSFLARDKCDSVFNMFLSFNKTYQSLCKSSFDFILNSFASQARPTGSIGSGFPSSPFFGGLSTKSSKPWRLCAADAEKKRW